MPPKPVIDRYSLGGGGNGSPAVHRSGKLTAPISWISLPNGAWCSLASSQPPLAAFCHLSFLLGSSLPSYVLLFIPGVLDKYTSRAKSAVGRWLKKDVT